MENKAQGNKLLDIHRVLEITHVKVGMNVADLGCGQFGFFVFPLATTVGKHGLIYAVDIMKSNLKEIEKKAKSENMTQIQTIWSNLEVFQGTKIESNSLDMAFLVNTLHQSTKKLDIIREAFRMLKRSGRLVIIDWEDTSSSIGPGTNKLVNKEGIKAGAKKLGFNTEQDFKAGEYYFGLILSKL